MNIRWNRRELSRTLSVGLAALLCLLCFQAAAQRERSEEQFRQMLQRFPNADLNKDGALTSDEYREFRRQAPGRGAPEASRSVEAVEIPNTLSGVEPTAISKPLADMTAEDRYKGEDGGLYGGGRNSPPEAHFKAALAEAAKIQPLDAEGKPSPNGKIVLLTHGMSNTTIESQRFIALANADLRKNPAVTLVDGAQGGIDTRKWVADTHTRGGASPWDRLEQRIKAADATAPQVQAIWMKHAMALKSEGNLRQFGTFPAYARQIQSDMAEIVVMLKKRYPNLKLVYISSRSYGGYATTQLNPEPYAYESAFGVRWLIQDQIKGVEPLDYASGKAPLLLWGPYLWADGEKGRKFDDLVYKREDFREDGTHPSDSGQQKIAEQLVKFFTTDPTAKIWFVKN